VEEREQQIDQHEDEIRDQLDELEGKGDEMDRGTDELDGQVGELRNELEQKESSSEAPGIQEPLDEGDDKLAVNAQEPGGDDDELTEDESETEADD
jgi:hypothetical protein